MQPTLKQVPPAAAAPDKRATPNARTPATSSAAQGDDAAASSGALKQPQQQQLKRSHTALDSKENMPAAATSSGGAGAAAIQAGSGAAPAAQANPKPAGSSHRAASKSGGSSKQQQQQAPSRTTQLFLDLGQRDFGASRCSVCGMLYARGHQEDEKLHKAFHTGVLQGLKFQGWAQERVVVSEPAQGRLLLVLQSDPVAHLKKAQELCAIVEKAHGMAPGWLLSAPQARVFLYVSAQRRVTGLAVVEPLKQAFRVIPAGGGPGAAEQEADSQQAAARASMQQQQQPAAAAAAAPMFQQQLQRERQPLLWPGLQRSGRRLAAGRAVASAGSTLLSGPSSGATLGATGGSSGGGGVAKADSCPNSLLLAAGAMQVAPGSGTEAGEQQPAAAAAAAVDVQHQQSQEMPPPPPVLVQQQQRGHAAAAAATSSCSHGAGDGPGGNSSRGAAAAAAAAGGGAEGGGGDGGGDGGGSKVLRIDRRRPVRAMLGVRAVWVLPEQRRKGLATKLLDAARCNMVPGYVVPCNQLAFIQPTGDGVALAAAFTGTQQFLVYGLE